jgi:hypothetical protein
MKLVKLGLRIWIAIGSIVGFLGGWILLAHAPKPASFLSSSNNSTAGTASTDATVNLNANPTPYPTIAPPPSLQDLQSGQSVLQPLQIQPAPQLPSVQNFAPRIRSGGS